MDTLSNYTFNKSNKAKNGKRRFVSFILIVFLVALFSLLTYSVCCWDQVLCSVAKTAYTLGEERDQSPINNNKPLFVFAAKLYRIAAERGNARGQYNLGVCYRDGIGIKKDEVEAFNWMLKAAEQGDSRAQCVLGGFYLFGEGVDIEKTGNVEVWI